MNNAKITGKYVNRSLTRMNPDDESNYLVTIELSPEESLTLKNCLDYCRHRLRIHTHCGLTKTGCTMEMVEALQSKWFGEEKKPKPIRNSQCDICGIPDCICVFYKPVCKCEEKAELPEEFVQAYSDTPSTLYAIKETLNKIIKYLRGQKK